MLFYVLFHHNDPWRTKSCHYHYFVTEDTGWKSSRGLPKVTGLLRGGHCAPSAQARTAHSHTADSRLWPTEGYVLVHDPFPLVQTWPALLPKCLQFHISVLQLIVEATL